MENFNDYFAYVGGQAYEKSQENLPLHESIDARTNNHNEGSNNIFRINHVYCNTVITITSLKESPMA